MAKTNNVIQVNFSAYETGITIPAVGTQYTLNGVNNSNFKRYQDSFDDSPTNAFIIKTIVNYIVGNGLEDKNGKIKPHDYISKADLRLICHDFKLAGSSFPQIINVLGKPIKIKHTPVARVGLNIDVDSKSNDYMEVNGYWYCWDYTKKFQFIPKFYPMFGSGETFEILHIKQLSSEPYFPYPDWFSGLKSAKIESALIDDAINHVSRGFQGKTIININNGAMMSEEEKEEVKVKIREGWTGTENSDGVTISVNESADEAIIVDTIEPRGRNEQFVTYDETAEIKLMAAHSAMNILFQRPGSSGFSNNADEIATATDSLYLGVINPMREIILDSLDLIFKKINPDCDIDFVNFGQEKAIVSDVLENEQLMSSVFEYFEMEQKRDSDGKFGSGDDGGESPESKKARIQAELKYMMSPAGRKEAKKKQKEKIKEITERGGGFKKGLSKEDLDKNTEVLDSKIQGLGLETSINKSMTSFGNSNYINVYEKENPTFTKKIRLSDHSTTSALRTELKHDNDEETIKEIKRIFGK